MATIQKKQKKDGTYSYKVMIRAQDGFPPAYKTLDNYQDAKDWAIQEEARRKQGLYTPTSARKKIPLEASLTLTSKTSCLSNQKAKEMSQDIFLGGKNALENSR